MTNDQRNTHDQRNIHDQPAPADTDRAEPATGLAKPGHPVFSGPATPTQAVRANGRPVTQVFTRPDQPAPQQPAADLPLGEDSDRRRD